MNRYAHCAPIISMLLLVSCYATGDRPRDEVKASARPTAAVVAHDGGPTIAYAVEELRGFLDGSVELLPLNQDASAEDATWVFDLRVDPRMDNGTFGVSYEKRGDGRALVSLRGADPACVLHAVYTMLERVGICFDVLGPILPQRIDLDGLIDWDVTVRPAVAKRGIRQHINFPMDISSYPLPEARDYIRNLARMRFNHITFHSYHGQWVPYTRSNGKDVLAGSFFYGQRHDLPESPHTCDVIRNEKTYCIPAIEPYYDQQEEKGRRAVEWLQAVMQQAKTSGMTLQFSIEAPGNLEDGLAACRSVLATYPLTDTLELITGESFGPGDKMPIDKQRERIERIFGPEMAADPAVVASLIDGQAPQWGPIQSFANNLKVAKALKAEMADAAGPSFALGAYVTDPQTLKVVVAIMRRMVPPDVNLTFLPSHGSRAAVDALKYVGLTADDWRRTMMYTWIEFDGNIYLQQNVVEGTRQMIEFARASLGGEQIPGLLFNHWRTAENRTAFRYAAVACVEGPVEPASFYKDYARSLGIGKPATYAAAMALLDDIDNRGRDELFNIGFCFKWCWFNPAGLGWTRGWKAENLAAVLEGFRSVRTALSECRPGTATDAGKQYLDFLDNRLECTDLHLQAIGHLVALHPLVDDKAPEKVDAETREKVIEHTDAAASERHGRNHNIAVGLLVLSDDDLPLNDQPSVIDHDSGKPALAHRIVRDLCRLERLLIAREVAKDGD